MNSQSNKMLLIVVPLACQLIYFAIFAVSIGKATDTYRQQLRATSIASKTKELQKLLYDSGVAVGGYSLTKSPLFSDRADKIFREIPEVLSELKDLIGDNTREQKILSNIAALTETGIKTLQEAKRKIDDNVAEVRQFRAQHMYRESRSISDRLTEELHGLVEGEPVSTSEADIFKNLINTFRIGLTAGVVLNLLIALGLLLVLRKK